jgi:hypothetical protein
MARRRSKSGKRGRAGAVAAEASTPKQRPELIPWRKRVNDLVVHLRDWSRASYAQAIAAFLEERFGAGAEPAEADIEAATDDFVCSAGSAGDGSSILRVFADHATGLEPEDRDQIRRWETERRRGVFIVQRARRDHLLLWDPLEGAPLTLHLLDKLAATRLQLVGPGTIVTAVFQPWVARLIAVGVEFFGDPRALQLFREETTSSGAQWHESPPPAPQRTREG